MNLFELPKETRIAPEQRTVLQKLRHNLSKIDGAGWRTRAAMAKDKLELFVESEADPDVALRIVVDDSGFMTVSGPFITVSTGSTGGELANFLRAAIHTGVLERRLMRGGRLMRTEIHTKSVHGHWKLWYGSRPLRSRLARLLPGRETVAARELRLASAIPLCEVPDPLGGERASVDAGREGMGEIAVGGTVESGALGGSAGSSGLAGSSDVSDLADRIGLGG